MDKGVWKEEIREDANKEGIGSHNRCQRGVCTKKGEGIPIIERGKRRGEGVYLGAAKEGIYPAIKVTSNSTSVLCRKKR